MPLPLIYIFHPYIRYIYNYYIVHIIAWIMSIVSSPRTSPTITLSGRIRKLARMRSRMVMACSPWVFSLRASSRTRLETPCICSSALSSMVMMRSSFGIKSDSAFKNVVLPEPVPPLMKILYPAITSLRRNCTASSVTAPHATSCCMVIGLLGN